MVLHTGAIQGYPGFRPPVAPRPDYKAYNSPHGPQVKVDPNFRGVNARLLTVIGKSAGLFGVAAGIAALFFASDVPRVRIDIMEKLPFVGDYWRKEIPADENPF